MSLALRSGAECLCLTRPRHDGDLVPVHLAVDGGDCCPLPGAVMERGEFLVAVPFAHQQADDLRIFDKRCPVRVVGGKKALVRVFGQQGKFKPDRPHHAVDRAFLGVQHRDDAGAGLKLDIVVAPLVVVQAVEAEPSPVSATPCLTDILSPLWPGLRDRGDAVMSSGCDREREFAGVMKAGGFDAVIGNLPRRMEGWSH